MFLIWQKMLKCLFIKRKKIFVVCVSYSAIEVSDLNAACCTILRPTHRHRHPLNKILSKVLTQSSKSHWISRLPK